MKIKCSKEMYQAILKSTLLEELKEYNINNVEFIVLDKYHATKFDISCDKDEIDYSDLVDILEQTEDYEEIEHIIDKYREEDDNDECCAYWFDYISINK